jgi:hypothetical protein
MAEEASDWLEGGCHCGAVRFRVEVTSFEALDCNCSICRMKGYLHVIVPKDRFQWVSGWEAVTTYRFNTRVAAHTFCATCGVAPFYRPRSHPDHVDVNARCLDGGAAGRFRVRAFDGEHWEDHVASIGGSS